jgi:NitT/TauT family transport system permease protein
MQSRLRTKWPSAHGRFGWLYPATTIALLLLFWQILATSGAVANYLLPAPIKVAEAIVRTLRDGSLLLHIVPTLTASALGWLFGGLLAALLAALVTEFVWVERALLLHLLGLQAIPKVSLAPLVFLWAGFGLSGNVILVTLICFFPVFANALAGFRSVNPSLLELMRAAGASRMHIWWHVKLPSAAPALSQDLKCQ